MIAATPASTAGRRVSAVGDTSAIGIGSGAIGTGGGRRLSTSLPAGSRSLAARSTPIATTPSAMASGSATGSPSAIAMTAERAPSVDTIGAAIETLPVPNAEYANSSPMLLPNPATRRNGTSAPVGG